MNNKKPNDNYRGLKAASECRAIEDYLIGMNGSRAMTVKFGGASNVISIGSTQTPTLYMIVSREREITNFKAEDYGVPFIELVNDKGELLTLKHTSKRHLSLLEALTTPGNCSKYRRKATYFKTYEVAKCYRYPKRNE